MTIKCKKYIFKENMISKNNTKNRIYVRNVKKYRNISKTTA